jgi:hypothetical protein
MDKTRPPLITIAGYEVQTAHDLLKDQEQQAQAMKIL